jgi:hypothetical protein
MYKLIRKIALMPLKFAWIMSVIIICPFLVLTILPVKHTWKGFKESFLDIFFVWRGIE